MNAADLLYAYMFAYRWGTAAMATMHPIRWSPPPPRSCARGSWACGSWAPTRTLEVLPDRRLRGHARAVRGRGLHLDAARGPGAGRGRCAALEHAALASHGADGGGGRSRLGGVLAEPRRNAAASNGSISCAPRRMTKRLAALVDDLRARGLPPRPSGSRWSSAEDARKRWAALAAFYRERGHFLVTNGPYRLKRWSPDSVTLEAFRDLSYPLGVGSYDAYAVPRRGFITKVERTATGSGCHRRHRADPEAHAQLRHRAQAAAIDCGRRAQALQPRNAAIS